MEKWNQPASHTPREHFAAFPEQLGPITRSILEYPWPAGAENRAGSPLPGLLKPVRCLTEQTMTTTMINSHKPQAEHLRRSALPGVLALAIMFLSGCASSGPSIAVVDQTLTEASKAVSKAEEVGAQEYAPLAFTDARDKVLGAQQAKADGNHAKALRLAEEAVVDAEYAEIKTLTVKAEEAARELRESVRALREEAARD